MIVISKREIFCFVIPINLKFLGFLQWLYCSYLQENLVYSKNLSWFVNINVSLFLFLLDLPENLGKQDQWLVLNYFVANELYTEKKNGEKVLGCSHYPFLKKVGTNI